MKFDNFISWQHVSLVLDVVLVSFIIYKILLLVRGTRAQPMLLGLGIVGFVYLASKDLSLVVLNWILSNFLGSAIILIVVLFQDDLRRALIKVGLIPGFGHDPRVENSIKEIVNAIFQLASKKTGALVAIQGDIGLEDYKEHAVKIDAIVSQQLIESIFNVGSPIHDGAVIINRDRIEAAGAVLPLTFNTQLVDGLGTRHRAALGLSERTDAILVVVSEETGTVSLIREGKITREITESNLLNALNRLTDRHYRRVAGTPSKIIKLDSNENREA